MPQEIFIPSKNKTLTFADDFSEQEIADYIDANFPRTGEDVSHDLKTRLLDPEWNLCRHPCGGSRSSIDPRQCHSCAKEQYRQLCAAGARGDNSRLKTV
jgi:hypothetical protein